MSIGVGPYVKDQQPGQDRLDPGDQEPAGQEVRERGPDQAQPAASCRAGIRNREGQPRGLSHRVFWAGGRIATARSGGRSASIGVGV